MPKIKPFVLNSNGKSLDLSTPKVMAILNLTPDSFYDGGAYFHSQDVLAQAQKFVSEGASIIDIGGMSSRPNAKIISSKKEIERILPAIKQIMKAHPNVWLSVDTLHSQTAKLVLEEGVDMINDISGGHYDKAMLSTVAAANAPFIAMHMRGTPNNMQRLTKYEHLIEDVYTYFNEIKQKSIALGMNNLSIDLGFGFAKTIAQNFELLNNLERFKTLNLPIVVGLSRKSMIWKTLNSSPKEALNGTTALHTIALLKGTNILRVHDVAAANEVIKMVTTLNQSKLSK